MPATRSRTSTEAPEVADEVKKTSDVTEQQPEKESEVKETTAVTEASGDEESKESSTADEKPVEENTNGSTDALPSDTNGDQSEDKVENGSAKRKSAAGDEAGDAPDSTDLTPKKAKLDADTADDANGKDTGAGEETDKQTPVETTA